MCAQSGVCSKVHTGVGVENLYRPLASVTNGHEAPKIRPPATEKRFNQIKIDLDLSPSFDKKYIPLFASRGQTRATVLH